MLQYHKNLAFAFTATIVSFVAGSIAIHLKSEWICDPLCSEDLHLLSELPARRPSQIRFAIEKLASYIAYGDAKSHEVPNLAYDFYPIIHITDYSPRNSSLNIEDDVPWHHLTQIGTRHRGVLASNTILVPAYRRKNYTIRNDVCVIDKQSTLVVSRAVYAEVETLNYATGLGLQIRQLLKASLNSPKAFAGDVQTLVESIRFTYANPSAMTSSVTFHNLWRSILDELQIMSLISAVETRIKTEQGIPENQALLIQQLAKLRQEAGHSSSDISRISDLAKTDIRAAWNLTRRLLEEVVQQITRATNAADESITSGDPLHTSIERLKGSEVLPDDIFACMDAIRRYGNIGSHSGGVVYNPSPDGILIVLAALLQVYEWYVVAFLPSVRVECPNADCGKVQALGQNFCVFCGTRMPPVPRTVCPTCKKPIAPGIEFCGNCGKPIRHASTGRPLP